MATKSRFPNLGNAQRVTAESTNCDGDSSSEAGSKRQITLSRFFKLPKKQALSDIAYDGDSVRGNSTQHQSACKTPPRKRSSSQASPSNSPKDGTGAKKKARKVATTPEEDLQSLMKHEKKTTKLSPLTLATLNSFSASTSSHLAGVDGSSKEKVIRDGERTVDGDSMSGSGNTSGSCDNTVELPTNSTSTSGIENHVPTIYIKTTFPVDRRKQTLEKNEKKKSKTLTGLKGKETLTPLEKQVMALKEENPDAILFVECGYRYRFFDKDAEIAARELNICAYEDHNYIVASIPTHRLFVHARRLVAKGYKVGVVKQTETAAIKAAGANKSTTFKREITALYTKSTMIGQDLQSSWVEEAAGEDEAAGSELNTFLLCVCEFQGKQENKSKYSMEIGIVAIQPSTGDIIYDSFHDNSTRQELETRVHHIKPVELLLPYRLSEETEKLLKGILSFGVSDPRRIRIERSPHEHFDKKRAFEEVSSFFVECQSNENLQEMLRLPVLVLCCLAALIKYLKGFKLDRIIRQTTNLRSFSQSKRCMVLNACVMQNLEIFSNQVDGQMRGSLLWVIDHTRTNFGKRELARWLSQPLTEASEIKLRQDAVQELLETQFKPLHLLRDFLEKSPDLEKSLCSIYHKKSSPAEFVNIIQSLDKVRQLCSTHAEYAKKEVKSGLLSEIFSEVPRLLTDVTQYFVALDAQAAKEGDMTRLFIHPEDFPEVKECMIDIEQLSALMNEHRRKIRLVLRMPALSFVMVSGYEYLVEVKNSSLNLVPGDWKRINATRLVSRFRPPFVEDTFKELCVAREKLVKSCQEAWSQFLEEFGEHFASYRQAVKYLARYDCILSLSEVAKQDGYCRPNILDSPKATIHIENGRHPVVSSLLGEGEQYVPNSTNLEADKERFMSISGPNMGGKSSYLKQVALIVILAQMGSHVPAENASITPVDAVYTRMGASDNIFKHQSTFMVELMEASTILTEATPHSLVIMDELGRGTSTHDGVAIAYAAAKHLISEVKCLTLFVSHYPPLADLERQYQGIVRNYHMAFIINESKETESDKEPGQIAALTFLYQLVEGAASRSYGLNVARMADLPTEILRYASQKSKEMEEKVLSKRERKENFLQLWQTERTGLRDLIERCHQS